MDDAAGIAVVRASIQTMRLDFLNRGAPPAGRNQCTPSSNAPRVTRQVPVFVSRRVIVLRIWFLTVLSDSPTRTAVSAIERYSPPGIGVVRRRARLASRAAARAAAWAASKAPLRHSRS